MKSSYTRTKGTNITIISRITNTKSTIIFSTMSRPGGVNEVLGVEASVHPAFHVELLSSTSKPKSIGISSESVSHTIT